MIGAGDLDKRIIIQTKTVTRGSFGSETETWTTLATVWANVQLGNGREFWSSQKINAETTGIFLIRFRKGLKPSMRVQYEGRIFDITAVINMQDRREFVKLEVKEVV